MLQPSLLSALLLVLTLFLSALLFHLTRRRDSRAQRRMPHLMRLLRFGGTLLFSDVARRIIRFELDLWSGPVARIIKHSAMTPSCQARVDCAHRRLFSARGSYGF